jgi:hypothetical protein
MWDWTSFVSGVIGAVLGAVAPLLVALLASKGARRSRQTAAIELIRRQIAELVQVVAGVSEDDEGGIPEEVVVPLMAALDAAATLQAELKPKDVVVAHWTVSRIFTLATSHGLAPALTTQQIVTNRLARFLNRTEDRKEFEDEYQQWVRTNEQATSAPDR